MKYFRCPQKIYGDEIQSREQGFTALTQRFDFSEMQPILEWINEKYSEDLNPGEYAILNSYIQQKEFLKDIQFDSSLLEQSSLLIRLKFAFEFHQKEKFKKLISQVKESRVNINKVLDTTGTSLLAEILMRGRLSYAQMLIKGGANPNLFDEDLGMVRGLSQLPTLTAFDFLRHQDTVDFNEMAHDEAGDTPLTAAIYYHDSTALNQLLTVFRKFKKIDLNFKNKSGDTPLTLAIVENYPEALDQLLTEGADCNVKAESGLPLEVAIHSGQEDMVQILLQHCPASLTSELVELAKTLTVQTDESVELERHVKIYKIVQHAYVQNLKN